MSKLKYTIAISIIFIIACKSPNQSASELLYTFNIESKILNETRIIDINVPNSYFDKILGAKKYPVIYVLDGEDMFELTSAMITFLSSKKGNRLLPECIVVGIRNIDRDKDLTHSLSLIHI